MSVADLVGPPEDGRPADDVELVDVAEAVDVRPRVEQRAHAASTCLAAAAQCSGVVLSPASRAFGIRASREQRADGLDVVSLRGRMQSGPALVRVFHHARLGRRFRAFFIFGRVSRSDTDRRSRSAAPSSRARRASTTGWRR